MKRTLILNPEEAFAAAQKNRDMHRVLYRWTLFTIILQIIHYIHIIPKQYLKSFNFDWNERKIIIEVRHRYSWIKRSVVMFSKRVRNQNSKNKSTFTGLSWSAACAVFMRRSQVHINVRNIFYCRYFPRKTSRNRIIDQSVSMTCTLLKH